MMDMSLSNLEVMCILLCIMSVGGLIEHVTTLACSDVFYIPPPSCFVLTTSIQKLIHGTFENPYVIIVSNSPEQSKLEVAQMLDTFLMTRPWWVVFEEKKDRSILIKINDVEIRRYLQATSYVQYPFSCADRMMFIRSYLYGFSEYGNEYSNIASNYQTSLGAIFDIYGMNITITKRISFLDNDYCPGILNKWNCAFLSSTNCSWPSEVTRCDGYDLKTCQVHDGVLYSEATPRGEIIDSSKAEKNLILLSSLLSLRKYSQQLLVQWKEVNNFENLSKASINVELSAENIFPIAFIFRLNHDFRRKVWQQISNFRRTTIPHLNSKVNCIMIHIRHDDRKLGLSEMELLKFCKEFIRTDNGCSNSTTGASIPHCSNDIDLDYGCSTAIPFGAITFNQYIQAAQSLVQDSDQRPDIFIITDDGKWVKTESKAYKKEWNIHIFPAPPNHREPSTANGANVFASFQLAQQCSGLVGHHGSAFTQLIHMYMCYQHRINGKVLFGECPATFDFSVLARG
jgi:hypothetical protein